MQTFFRVEPSACGRLLLVVDGAGAVLRIEFLKGHEPGQALEELEAKGFVLTPSEERTLGLATQLADYFAGVRRDFDLELAPAGTPFQLEVWRMLRRVPYGTTTSYGELSRRLGRPQASRAVGAANGANPIPIVVPCHRVIGADGSLTGFGGGLDAKRVLLDLERRVAGPLQRSLAFDQAGS